MLIDSNIIIFSAQAHHYALRQFIAQHAPSVSAVSYIEVLGYYRLTASDKQYFEAFFATATVLPISQPIIELVVKLRQQRKMTLGDALIAATCLVHSLTLVTNNTRDFSWIAGLSLLDPFANTPGSADLLPT